MEYRKTYVGNTDQPFYAIEKFKDNKWKFCFAEFDRKTADVYIDNPYLIESQIKKYKITGICVLIFMIICVIYLSINY
jgi:hypothetical protein